jgi:hypothetical protein
MITLGTITDIDNDSNFCKVRLPTLEGVGNITSTTLTATQMLPPGISAGYEVGDVVFVAFVDNSLGRPVVLGQLYKGPNKGTKIDGIGNDNDNSLGEAATMNCGELTVSGKAILPLNTVLIGNPETYNLAKLISDITDLKDKLAVVDRILSDLNLLG